MEPANYLRVLRRRWWIVLLSVVVGLGAAGAFDVLQTPRYRAQTRLLVAGAARGNVAAEETSRQVAVARASAYAQLIETEPGVALAAGQSGVGDQHPSVTAEAEPATPFITVVAEADTAVGAQALASAFRTALPRIVQILEQAPDSALPAITVLEPALPPRRPASPLPIRDLPVAALLGLFIGAGAAFLREALDARLRDTDELERIAEATLLGAVPRQHANKPLPTIHLPRSGRSEAYRHVRTNLEFSGPGGMPRSIAITSAGAGEGKSSLAANLAVAAARAGRDVVVVDADLRKPSQARYFGAESTPGLTELLAGMCSLDAALRPVRDTRVVLLPSGTPPGYPSELIGSAAMAGLIEDLETRFDLVIIDTPPVLPVPDALAVAVHVDGVVVVARMAETRRASLRRAVAAVRAVGADVLGVVGNAAVRHEEQAYGSPGRYGYGRRPEGPVVVLDQLVPAGRRRADARAAGSRGRRVAAPTDVTDSQLAETRSACSWVDVDQPTGER